MSWGYILRDGRLDGLVAVTHPVIIGKEHIRPNPDVSSRAQPSSALSSRENAVVDALLAGTQPGRIAQDLGISVHTVRNHLKSIYRRLGVHSKHELFAMFMSAPGGRR
jgi:DNA-binding NarL/FixJ family response regulator